MSSQRFLRLPMFLIVFGALIFSGCLKTRTDVAEVEQHNVLSEKVTTLQRDNADVNSRFSEVNEGLRDLRGRVEVIEDKVSSKNGDVEQTKKALAEEDKNTNRKISLLQESLTKMEAQVAALTAEVQAAKAEAAAARGARAAEAASSSKNTFEAGMDAFNGKDYKKAILVFQSYREKNPKAKNLADATYHIGLSFQQLSMKDEAKSFYEEVIAKYPNSEEAKKSKARIKKLKSSSSK